MTHSYASERERPVVLPGARPAPLLGHPLRGQPSAGLSGIPDKSGDTLAATSSLLGLEAENALLDYLDGIETWKHRFEWDVVEGFGGAGGSGGRSFFQKFSLFVGVLIAVLAVIVYLESGKVPRNMVIAAIVVPLIGLQFHSFTKSKP